MSFFYLYPCYLSTKGCLKSENAPFWRELKSLVLNLGVFVFILITASKNLTQNWPFLFLLLIQTQQLVQVETHPWLVLQLRVQIQAWRLKEHFRYSCLFFFPVFAVFTPKAIRAAYTVQVHAAKWSSMRLVSTLPWLLLRSPAQVPADMDLRSKRPFPPQGSPPSVWLSFQMINWLFWNCSFLS